MIRSVYEFFRYDILIGIRNLIYFFGPVWGFQSCDYSHSAELFMYGLIRNKKAMAGRPCLYGSPKGFLELRQAEAIDEAIDLLQMVVNDDTRIILDEYKWRRLWKIIRGSGKIPGSDMRGWWT